jgi:hypothetical protein
VSVGEWGHFFRISLVFLGTIILIVPVLRIILRGGSGRMVQLAGVDRPSRLEWSAFGIEG